MKKKFAVRYNDAKKTNDEEIMCEYKKLTQITIIKLQISLRTTIDA